MLITIPKTIPEPEPVKHKRYGRREPYTEEGVKRLPCTRCGEPAMHQWNVCSDWNLHRPICKQCDIELNLLVLWFMRDPDWQQKIDAYKESFDE